jgi:hypothetical protein
VPLQCPRTSHPAAKAEAGADAGCPLALAAACSCCCACSVAAPAASAAAPTKGVARRRRRTLAAARFLSCCQQSPQRSWRGCKRGGAPLLLLLSELLSKRNAVIPCSTHTYTIPGCLRSRHPNCLSSETSRSALKDCLYALDADSATHAVQETCVAMHAQSASATAVHMGGRRRRVTPNQ